MYRKFANVRFMCALVGTVAFLVCAILPSAEGSIAFMVIRLIMARLAFIAFAVKCVVEIAIEEKFGYSIFCVLMAILAIVQA